MVFDTLTQTYDDNGELNECVLNRVIEEFKLRYKANNIDRSELKYLLHKDNISYENMKFIMNKYNPSLYYIDNFFPLNNHAEEFAFDTTVTCMYWEKYKKFIPKRKYFTNPNFVKGYIIKHLDTGIFIRLTKRELKNNENMLSTHMVSGILAASILHLENYSINHLAELYDVIYDSFFAFNDTDIEYIRDKLKLLSSIDLYRNKLILIKTILNPLSKLWDSNERFNVATADDLLNFLKSIYFTDLNHIIESNDKKYQHIFSELFGQDLLDEDSVDDIVRLWDLHLNRKNNDIIPNVNIKHNDMILCKLETGDPIALTLGRYTNCCQYYSGIGSSCVEFGLVNENSGFYIVKNTEDTILAQAWVYTYKNIFIIDNIEINDAVVSGEDVKEIWLILSKALIKEHKFSLVVTGINHNKVFIGYGERIQITIHGFHEFIGDTYTDTSNGCYILDSNIKVPKCDIEEIFKVIVD